MRQEIGLSPAQRREAALGGAMKALAKSEGHHRGFPKGPEQGPPRPKGVIPDDIKAAGTAHSLLFMPPDDSPRRIATAKRRGLVLEMFRRGYRQTAIADLVGCWQPAISRDLRVMESMGLISRGSAPLTGTRRKGRPLKARA